MQMQTLSITTTRIQKLSSSIILFFRCEADVKLSAEWTLRVILLRSSSSSSPSLHSLLSNCWQVVSRHCHCANNQNVLLVPLSLSPSELSRKRKQKGNLNFPFYHSIHHSSPIRPHSCTWTVPLSSHLIRRIPLTRDEIFHRPFFSPLLSIDFSPGPHSFCCTPKESTTTTTTWDERQKPRARTAASNIMG